MAAPDDGSNGGFVNESAKNDSPRNNDDQRPVARSVISAIAIGALTAMVGLTTACCQGANASDADSDGESN